MAIQKQEVAWRLALDRRVEACSDRMREVREYLHAHPEPSGSEFETARFLHSQFDTDRFVLNPVADGRGLIVTRVDPSPEPSIVLRADIDALPIQDAKSAPYRSTQAGVMHACGHDGHVATVLGAIWALEQAHAAEELPWPVPWRAIFQPAEETNLGALEMVKAGALESTGAIIAAHMDPSRKVGSVGVRDGAFTADCVEVRLHVLGRGGHAARPHESLDPIAATAQLISSIYLFVPRTTDALDPIVVSFGSIHGGSTPNAIPDEVHVTGTLRTYRAQTRRRAQDHIQKLCHALAQASDTRIEIEFIEGPPAVTNDQGLTALIRHEATELLGASHVDEIERPSMGGEDFANYLDHVPGAMFRLGCAAMPGAPPLHSPMFDLDPIALTVGAKILARTAVAWSQPSAT